MRLLGSKYWLVALSFVGSAILLFACDSEKSQQEETTDESLMTEYVEHLSLVMSQNGRRSYFFVTPLMEGYTQAREPYREFRKGVEITTYQDDSLTSVNATLTANYAIYYEKRELWEAKGNVVVKRFDGRILYTQQLFWNARTKKIYSNVDTKVVQEGTQRVMNGEGFESDEEFKDWRFRKQKSRLELELKPTETDSTAVKPAPAIPEPVADAPKRERPERTTDRPTDRPVPSEAVRHKPQRELLQAEPLEEKVIKR